MRGLGSASSLEIEIYSETSDCHQKTNYPNFIVLKLNPPREIVSLYSLNKCWEMQGPGISKLIYGYKWIPVSYKQRYLGKHKNEIRSIKCILLAQGNENSCFQVLIAPLLLLISDVDIGTFCLSLMNYWLRNAALAHFLKLKSKRRHPAIHSSRSTAQSRVRKIKISIAMSGKMSENWQKIKIHREKSKWGLSNGSRSKPLETLLKCTAHKCRRTAEFTEKSSDNLVQFSKVSAFGSISFPLRHCCWGRLLENFWF